MAFTPENAPEFEKKDDNDARLRCLERQFGWVAQPWHFSMLETLSPNDIFGFFSKARMVDGTMWHDGGSTRGKVAYSWCKNIFRDRLSHVFGNFRVALAARGVVISEFWTQKDMHPRLCSRSEILLMLDCASRATRGQTVDPKTELSAYRQNHGEKP